MTLFLILAILLVAAGLAIILPGVLNQHKKTSYDQLQTNIDIAKERKATLQKARDVGAMDEASYASELHDIEQSLAIDMQTSSKGGSGSRAATFEAVIIALFLPISAGALYLHLGEPAAIDSLAHDQVVRAQMEQNSTQASPPPLQELLPQLEARLEANPDDQQGWMLLGRTYLSMSDFPNANRALKRAYEIDSNDPNLLAMLAESTAMLRDGNLSGEATGYLERALELNPDHEQSLWLRAIGFQQTEDHTDAIAIFKRLRAGISNNESAIATIDDMIARSTQALTSDSQNASNLVAPADPTASPQDADGMTANATNSDASADTKAAITLSVQISEAALAAVTPDQSVFIYARASNGPPMPLAVSRHRVSELPVTVTLDNSMAMIPAMTISQFPNITVGARVSQSGNAIAQPGDWFSEVSDVLWAETNALKLTISEQKR